MIATHEIQRGVTHRVTGADGYDRMHVKGADAKGLISYALKAYAKQWHVEAVNEAALELVLYKPAGQRLDWYDPDAPSVPGELARKIDREIGSYRFEQKNRFRREVLGEVYVICQDCGGKLWSDDALPGEKEDRAIPCPSMNKLTGKCEL